MTLYRDSREKVAEINEACDDKKLLEYEGPMGEKFSYDFEIHTVTGAVLKVERKSWLDFVQSWKDNKMERQVGAVDLLIVEFTKFNERDSIEVQVNALKHLTLMSLLMPVVITTGFKDTVMRMRYIEKREDGFVLRQNKIRTQERSLRVALLEVLPGINPYRKVNGVPLSDWIIQFVDWEGVANALKAEEWTDRIDWGTSKKLSPLVAAKIRKELVDPAPPQKGDME